MKLQVALDFCKNYQNAKTIIDDIEEYVDIIELGTPLLMECGLDIITKIKSDYPEKIILSDLKIMDKYYKDWRLTPNPAKSEVTLFHLSNREASKELNVTFDGVPVKFNPNPVYLGLKLDRSLSFKEHITGLSKKTCSKSQYCPEISRNWLGRHS